MEVPVLQGSGAWWREREILWIVGLVVVVYFLRTWEIPVRGEEPRRARVAYEMIHTGDWVVPREQGNIFPSRPPLQNWLIAFSYFTFGDWTGWTIRFPSLLATLGTCLAVYAYGRTFQSRFGALASAVVYATFGEVMQLGWKAETEPVFIFLVSASLLVWHAGLTQGWRWGLGWVGGYGLMGLAFLAKGPQAPVYFCGTVGVYLLGTRRWRDLFSVGHLAGLATGAALIAAWVWPCAALVSLGGVRAIVANDSLMRFMDWDGAEVGLHLLQFPAEIFGCLLPWSPLLFVYLHPALRRELFRDRACLRFIWLVPALVLPTCWIPPQGMTRYLAPMYPFIALGIGAVIETCARAEAGSLFAIAWRRQLTFALLCMTAAVSIYALNAVTPLHRWLEPLRDRALLAVAYIALLVGATGLLWLARRSPPARSVRFGVSAIAVFLAVTFTGVMVGFTVRRSEDSAVAISRLRHELPPGTHLVSFGPIDANFAFHYEDLIENRPLPTSPRDDAPAWFCMDYDGGKVPPLPFAWEPVATISMDRARSANPERVVIVGRRKEVMASRAP